MTSDPFAASNGASTDAAVLSVEGVHKWLGTTYVLRGVDLQVHRQEIVVIIGPSGSGKSTLLRCINHLEPIDAGQILLGGKLMGYYRNKGSLYEQSDADVAAMRQQIGMVFQQFNLFSHMTALENVSYGPRRVLNLSRDEAEDRAIKLLQRVGLQAVANSHPSRLSGGQQQRVAIARALAMDPQLILFDEPTSSLDPELVHEVLSVMIDVAEQGMTMIVVTHEIDFAQHVGHQLVMMDEGRIVEKGPCSETILNPQHPRTEQFLKRVRRDA